VNNKGLSNLWIPNWLEVLLRLLNSFVEVTVLWK